MSPPFSLKINGNWKDKKNFKNPKIHFLLIFFSCKIQKNDDFNFFLFFPYFWPVLDFLVNFYGSIES